MNLGDRKLILSASLKREDAELWEQLAQRETGGNRSKLLRSLLHEAAERRGVKVAGKAVRVERAK